MTGAVGILNVGAGDTKLSFDRENPAERIRAARIVKDMIRRGYALLVETGQTEKGEPVYQRAHDFDETKAEYIIADFDPCIAAVEDAKDDRLETTEPEGAPPPAEGRAPAKGRRGGRQKRIDAGATSAIAVARVAGG